MKSLDRRFFALRACAIACGLLCCATVSVAAPPAAAKPSAPAAKAQPATPDDPAKVAAAREFVILYHPQTDPANVKKMLDDYIPRAIEVNKKREKNFDPKKFEADLRTRVMTGAAKKIDLQSHVVSRHFSLAELKALIALFKSPLGTKLVVETPKIQRDMLQIRREMGKSMKGSTYYDDSKDDEDEDGAPAKKPAPKPPAVLQKK